MEEAILPVREPPARATTTAPAKMARRKATRTPAIRRRAQDIDSRGFLRKASVTAATAIRYEDSARDLGAFVRVHGEKKLSLKTAEKADVTVERYTEHLFRQGESRDTARYALYGLAWSRAWPTRSTAFPRYKQALTGWDKAEPPSSREPIPVECLALLVEDLHRRGDVEVEAAAAMVLSFDGYLRPSEAVTLERRQLVVPYAGSPHWGLIIAPSASDRDGLRHEPSKMGTYDDASIMADDAARRGHLRPVLQALASRKDRLFPALTLPKLESCMKAVCARLGFKQSFVPHQLRHGGASHDALHRLRDARGIQRHGRWKARERRRGVG